VNDALIEGVRAVYRDVVNRARATDRDAALVVMGHVYMDGTKESELSERRILGGNQHALPVDIFPTDAAYVALGHLHRAQRVAKDERVRYSGSPIPLSFAEATYPHQVALVDLRRGRLENVRSLLVPHRVQMLRIPAAGPLSLDGVIRALGALPAAGLFDDPLRPFLEVTVTVDKPEPTLQQQVQDALKDRGVRLLRLSCIQTGTAQPLADALRGRALEDLSPEQVFVERHRREFKEPPSSDLVAAFHELVALAHEARAGR
jgi:exonuclease SbcD